MREPPGDALATVAGSGDVRLLWLHYDLVRFVNLGGYAAIQVAIGELSGIADVPSRAPSVRILGDWLIAWDLPAPPGYRELKRDLYLLIEPRWEPLFADPEDAVDWRVVAGAACLSTTGRWPMTRATARAAVSRRWTTRR